MAREESTKLRSPLSARIAWEVQVTPQLDLYLMGTKSKSIDCARQRKFATIKRKKVKKGPVVRSSID